MSQYSLLRSTLQISKFSYLMRCVDMSSYLDLLSEFDNLTLQSLNELMGSALSPSAAAQAALPTSLGGLGLRRSRDHAPVAYAASVSASLNRIFQLLGADPGDPGDGGDGGRGEDNVGDDGAGGDNAERSVTEELIVSKLLTPAAMARLSESVGVVVTVPEIWAGVSQKDLSRRTDENQLRKLRDSFTNSDSVRDLARLSVLGQKKALEYLSCVPCKRSGQYLRPDQWVVMTRYILGEPIYDSDRTCPACNSPSDKWGHHALTSCGQHGGEIVTRHNVLRNFFFDLSNQAGLNPVKEARFLLPGGRKPADVLLPWSGGLVGGDPSSDLCADLTITGLRDCYLSRTVDDGSYPAVQAHVRKENLVGAACRNFGLTFVPVAMCALGSMTPTTYNLISRISKDKAIRTGADISKTINNSFKKLNILLMRSNSNLLLNRCPVIRNVEADIEHGDSNNYVN